jgi:hypothetical protein
MDIAEEEVLDFSNKVYVSSRQHGSEQPWARAIVVVEVCSSEMRVASGRHDPDFPVEGVNGPILGHGKPQKARAWDSRPLLGREHKRSDGATSILSHDL